MEALSTYNTIQEIARQAAKNYTRTSGEVEHYAQQVVSLYRSESASNPIRNNVYHRYLLEEYSGTVKNEIVKIINTSDSGDKVE